MIWAAGFMVAIGLCFVAYALSEIADAIQRTTFIVKLPDTINVNTVNHIQNVAARALADYNNNEGGKK